MQRTIQEIQRLHDRVFRGEENDIPLIVSPRIDKPDGIEYPDSFAFKERTAESMARAAKLLQPKVDVGSDWIPTLTLSFYQSILVPSLLGAETVIQSGSEPMAKRVPFSMESLLDRPLPAIEGALVDEMLTMLQTALRHLPDGFRLSVPIALSPFDIAQLMFGEELFILAMTEPALTRTILLQLADLCIAAVDRVKKEMGQPPEDYITSRGLFFPGLRLACDALVVFSPGLIRDMALPVLERFAKRYGKVCVHFCTAPAYAGHVLPVLLESEWVGAVDNWQGPDVFLGPDAPVRMQDKIAVITDVDLKNAAAMRGFLERDSVRNVPRKGGRGIVLGTSAQSVEDGKRIYDTWRSMDRNTGG